MLHFQGSCFLCKHLNCSAAERLRDMIKRFEVFYSLSQLKKRGCLCFPSWSKSMQQPWPECPAYQGNWFLVPIPIFELEHEASRWEWCGLTPRYAQWHLSCSKWSTWTLLASVCCCTICALTEESSYFLKISTTYVVGVCVFFKKKL